MAMLFDELVFEIKSCNAIYIKNPRDRYSYTTRIGDTAIGSPAGVSMTRVVIPRDTSKSLAVARSRGTTLTQLQLTQTIVWMYPSYGNSMNSGISGWNRITLIRTAL